MKFDGILLKPIKFNWLAYREVVKNPMILSGYKNSVIVLVAGTFLSVFLTALGAFILTRKNTMIKKPILLMVMIPMFIHGGMIPTFLVVKKLNMLNTLWSLFLPGLISTHNLLIMRTSFAGLPDSIEEAAKIDGANDFTVFTKIVIPLSKAIISVMILYYGVGCWNSWFSAYIYLNKRSLFPLQLILREILIQSSTDSMSGGMEGDAFAVSESIKYAVIVFATLPILCIYPFLQKRIQSHMFPYNL